MEKFLALGSSPHHRGAAPPSSMIGGAPPSMYRDREVVSNRASTPIVEVKRRRVAEEIVYRAHHPQPQQLHPVSTRGHCLITLPTGEIDPKSDGFQLLLPRISFARFN